MADQPVRLIALAVGLALSLSACSSSDDDTEELGATTEATVSSTSSTVSTTTSTEATTTTLSELQIAEAEVEQVVTGWWTFIQDTSQEGNAEERSEFTTGLLFQRGVEFIDSLDADGLILRIPEPSPIQITDVAVDLGGGVAEVTACVGSTALFVDVETQEVVSSDDPEDANVGTFQLQLIAEGWKINEFLPTAITENPTPCEIEQ